MSKVICEKEELTAVADAIRAKTDTTAAMSLGEMATNVMNISGGGGSEGRTLKTITRDTFNEAFIAFWELYFQNIDNGETENIMPFKLSISGGDAKLINPEDGSILTTYNSTMFDITPIVGPEMVGMYFVVDLVVEASMLACIAQAIDGAITIMGAEGTWRKDDGTMVSGVADFSLCSPVTIYYF